MQQTSLTKYARYIWEKAGHQLIEGEHGFITFEVGENFIHIHDLWVDPDYRHKGHGSDLVQKVIDSRKNDSIKFLTSCVQLKANDVTQTLKAQLHYGFYVVGGNENEIKLAKEL